MTAKAKRFIVTWLVYIYLIARDLIPDHRQYLCCSEAIVVPILFARRLQTKARAPPILPDENKQCTNINIKRVYPREVLFPGIRTVGLAFQRSRKNMSARCLSHKNTGDFYQTIEPSNPVRWGNQWLSVMNTCPINHENVIRWSI